MTQVFNAQIEIETLKRRMDAFESRLEAALTQSRSALAASDRASRPPAPRGATASGKAILTLALANTRPAVIAAALGLRPANVSQHLTNARARGIAVPLFPAVRMPPSPGEIARARALVDADPVPVGYVRPPFDMRRALYRMTRFGRPDNLFVALARAHPAGPPLDILPKVEDGRPIALPKPAALMSSAGSAAALCVEAA